VLHKVNSEEKVSGYNEYNASLKHFNWGGGKKILIIEAHRNKNLSGDSIKKPLNVSRH